jgi:type I site-specific restriction-modification system R (restriction) subunit
MKKLITEWRQYEQQQILIEGFDQALEEGKVGEWISNNLKKLMPVVKTFKEKLEAGVEPFTIAIQKWKAGEKLSDEEKKNFIKALAQAGILLLPGGTTLMIIRHLVINQMGGIS